MKIYFWFIFFIAICSSHLLSQSNSSDYIQFSGRIHQIINKGGGGRGQHSQLEKSYPAHYKVLLSACDNLGYKTGEVFSFTTDEDGFFSLKLPKGNYLIQSETCIYEQKIYLIKLFADTKKDSTYELYQYILYP